MLELLFNHIVLPPRLPGKEDSRLEDVEQGLITRLLLASRIVRDLVHVDYYDNWDSVRRSIQTCKVVNSGGKIDKKSLLNELRGLQTEDIIILHVAQQNAGLLIRRKDDLQGKVVIFEAFEASPLSEQVLASESALQWDFPGCAVSIPLTDFENTFFQDELAGFLEQASRESIARFAASTSKAGSSAYESRGTADPSIITQMLMTLLEANGQRVFPPLLRKRVRDDVCWNKGAENPWRRCALWLVIRVAVQRHLYTLFGDEAGRVHYKFLMCVVLARLLDDALEHLSPDLLHFLKAKLCRRIVKLEVDKEKAPHTVVPSYEHLFAIFGPIFKKTLQAAISHIGSTWENYKKSIRRLVPSLPRYAEQKDLYLTLPNSGSYLQKVLTQPLSPYHRPQTSVPWEVLADYQASAPTVSKNFESFMRHCFSVSELETDVESNNLETPEVKSECEERCILLSNTIETYLQASASIYESNPEEQSMKLLTIMELWMLMDKCAIKLFDLLPEYHPGFLPDILDVLQIPRLKDMRRLQSIQQYLQGRVMACNGSRTTIFIDPKHGCFAERYFDESQDSFRLTALYQQIVIVAEAERQEKEDEWKKLSAEYEILIQNIASSTCLFSLDNSSLPAVQVHNDRHCSKCFLERTSRRMKIRAYEDPLPSNVTFAKAVVFELGIPKAFAAYRDTTWKIMGSLARLDRTESLEPRLLLREYSELKHYALPIHCSFSLASTTKSFLMTHYANVRFPTTIHSVILPNGLKYGYFDKASKQWPGRQPQKLSFAQHCRLTLPKNSPFSSIHLSSNFAINGDGPTSYEVIASQGRCPPGLNVHEFMAYQILLSGENRRWLTILIELGSSNLNFSSESVAILISHLATQAGPGLEKDPLRIMHRIFKEESFCRRLLDQIGQRLESISPNFREIFCMEMLVTLMLRLHSLASEPVIISKAVKLLERARSITHKWALLLRDEIYAAKDVGDARKWSHYAFMSAILCKRTFAFLVEDHELLNSEALRCFIEVSIILHDNLTGDPSLWSYMFKTAFIRDLKMVHRMRLVLPNSVRALPKSLVDAIGTFWPEPAGTSRLSYTISFKKSLQDPWVQVIFEGSKECRQQVVHYHLLKGILVVDGAQLGKLPQEHREAVVLRQLFGSQSLLTYPSVMPGMTYMLGFHVHGHQIHLGFRNGNLIVRAFLPRTVLEFIPRDVFNDGSSFDLPAELVDNCVHWLDLSTGIIEVRREPEIWKSKLRNWRINVNTRQGTRARVNLVDPRSLLAERVAGLFDCFEYARQLTVFQPLRGPLQVECRRLELSFSVNSNNALESRQLGAEIDSDQDAGTWYGLRSKLVLRDSLNPRFRSIIVPMGAVTYKRDKMHVVIEIVNQGAYGKFTINAVLGRLECAAEPRLLYLKAYLHACTSSFLVDKLTLRTGTEEALHILKSGYCQPWMPLTVTYIGTLTNIAKLTPLREFYPKDKKIMQCVSWNEDLTTAIQHDGFRAIVEAITERSAQLSMFSFVKVDVPSIKHNGDQHLIKRGYARRSLYQRLTADSDRHTSGPDVVYIARGRPQGTQSRLNAYEVASTIRTCTARLPTTEDLAGILQNWINIGGYHGTFDKILLSDQLDADFKSQWGSLVNFCRASNPKDQDRYRLMFLFGTISFRKDVNMDVIRVLLAFSILDDLKSLEPPKWPCYLNFRQNQVPYMNYLVLSLKPFCRSYPGDVRSTLNFKINAKQRRALEAVELAHEQQVGIECKDFAQFLMNQWPCLEPDIDGFPGAVLIDLPSALEFIRGQWQQMFQNWELSCHIRQVQQVLDRNRVIGKIALPPSSNDDQWVYSLRCRGGEIPTVFHDLLRKTGPLLNQPLHHNLTAKNPRGSNGDPSNVTPPEEINKLEEIITSFAQSKSTVRQQYAEDLKRSLNAVKVLETRSVLQEEVAVPLNSVRVQISSSKRETNQQFDRIYEALQNADACSKWLDFGDIYPSITPVTLLESLRSISAAVFGQKMKESVLSFALSITGLQRLIRIEDAHLKGNIQKIHEEQKNEGHTNWDVMKYPEWVLLEIDANIIIRPDQVDVALATIEPYSGANSVLQMNMGQGKTSCILPMAATILADTKRLMRVIIPKPLLLQTAQLFHARLGGLLGREIRHVPFSRKTPTDHEHIQSYFQIHKDILKSSGVILALPEHVLSFKLSGLQRLSDGRISECRPMVKVQGWISNVARDVIDECDFTLAVKTQLIYPSGSQTSVDGHPQRWETAEVLLHLIDGHLFNLQEHYPQSIEIVRRPQGGFPMIFFLRKDVENALLSLLVEDVISGRTSILPTKDCTISERLFIRSFISLPKVEKDITERLHQIFQDNPIAKQNLYLLRGLLVHRILLLCLKKRWQVQYGTHPERDPIAVPFQAKGLPSEQAEFGHIDVAIILTILAFYYQGLDIGQLRQSLEHVVKSDDPSSAYNRWTHTAYNLPDSLKEWNVINVDDEAQLAEIWQHVRYNIVVINYFLNNFVFPKHAKQFQLKLQASGWDIPLFSREEPQGSGRSSKALTTGFSGTNDNKRMLPLTVTQDDLPGLLHTSASVLKTLLEPRNRRYVPVANIHGRHISELEFLSEISRMGLRILIDAGAMILELDNLGLAKAWLKIFSEPPAVIYFDKGNKAWVLYRKGHQIPLLASPFADNIGDCLVYIDEAHTRGTDLKLPANARGALTLGPGITKDATVQAAMRLRQLATTQSVVFFAPPEVHQSILDVRQKRHGDVLDSNDVIYWLIEQTCEGIEQLQPLFFSQGVDFCLRNQASSDNKDFLDDVSQRENYLSILRQVERQTLEQLYNVRTHSKSAVLSKSSAAEITAFMKELNTRRKGFQDTGNAVHASALQEVEQEREVAFEVEAVREMKKPVQYFPQSFDGLHRDIVGFVKTGRLAAGSAGYEQAFLALRKTALGLKYGISSDVTNSHLYVSTEFTKTIFMRRGQPNDNFQRQVNWILWSCNTETALIVNPEEAERILPLLYNVLPGVTHLLTYATPVTRKMLHFNRLKYYAVPPLPDSWIAPSWLKVELGIFAGRLYFEYDEYADLCLFLGVQEADGKLAETDLDNMMSSDEQQRVENFVEEEVEAAIDGAAGTSLIKQSLPSFTKKPLTFLHEWLAIRRKGQDFAHTPMGYMCQGKPLTVNHPFFSKAENNGIPTAEGLGGRVRKASANVAAELVEGIGTEDEGEFEDDDDGGGYYDDDVNDVNDKAS